MSKRIMIVDDDKVIIEVVKTALTKKGYEVATASDGTQGLELLKMNVPDLILLDVMMPEMNGYEFLRALKAQRSIEGLGMIPVVVITAKEEMEDLFKFEGVRDYLIKPVDSAELVAKIEHCLESHR